MTQGFKENFWVETMTHGFKDVFQVNTHESVKTLN